MVHSRFVENSQPFAFLGYFLSETARLEVALDEFMFALNETDPDLVHSIAKSAPIKIENKLDFYVEALLRFGPLRCEPIFSDGELEVNSLLYSILEIYEVRNALAHGAVDIIETSSDYVKYSAWKYARAGKNRFAKQRFSIAGKNRFAKQRFSIGSGLLEELWYRGRGYRRYFERLTLLIRNGENWEKLYQDDKAIRDGRARMNELGSVLGFEVPDFSDIEELKLVFRSSSDGREDNG